jgi:toxin ParE1/3/4
MTGSYRVSPRAEADLEEIWRYTVRKWSADQADRYIRDLVAAFDDLATGRRAGRSAEDVRRGYWKQLVGSHVIYFRQTDAGIEVMRVLHGRMDVTKHI